MGLVSGSLCWEVLLLLASLGVYGYLWYRSRTRYFRDTRIPTYIPYEGFLKNNTFGALAEGSMGDVYDGLYRGMSGHRYGGFYNTLRPCIMIRDPALGLAVLTTHYNHFLDHGLTTDENTNPLEGNLFFLSGPRWKNLRRKLSPTFTSGKLKNMFALIEECTESLIALLHETGEKEQEVKELLARFTTDVIGSTAFGLEPVSIKDADSQFRKMGRKFFNPSPFTLFKGISRMLFPWFFRTFRIMTQPKEIVDFFVNLTSATLEHRIRSGLKRNDFIQLLLELKMKGSVEMDPQDGEELADLPPDNQPSNIEFTDKLLAAQAFVFFIAGFETTSSAISFTLYLLAKHPEVQERAREEVREAKRKHGGRMGYDAVRSMTYLEACLSESMRLFPPVQALPRLCTKDFRMEDGYVIKKGMLLFIPIFSLHRDPEYFPEPEAFRPERFLGETPTPGTYLPFGGGPRICVGMRFAVLESTLALAKILESFEVLPGLKGIETPLKLRSRTFVVVPASGLWLRFRKL